MIEDEDVDASEFLPEEHNAEAQRVWDEDLLSVLKTREGRAVLHRFVFANEFGAKEFPVFSENALRMAWASGKNSVGRKIWSEVKRVAPDLMRMAEDEYEAGLRARKG